MRCSLKTLTLTLALILVALACPDEMGIQIVTPTEAAVAQEEFFLEEATIADIQGAIRAGDLTAERLAELYLARIKAYNGTCVNQPEGILGPVTTIPNAGQLNALATLNLRPETRLRWGFDARKARSMTDAGDDDPAMPDALETARALDTHFAETGEFVGPLHGVVMAIKDQYDTFDMRTTSGADAFYADDRPPDDATFVRRLREAGAIIIGKSNLGEFASAIPRSAFGGTFCNPYDTERSPGGSSSGSGSAVGANLVTCAIAEETGSSIRSPAYSNNSVGIAATQELVSRDGMIQQGINTRVGPICRTVKDAARVLDVIAGYDPEDELTAFSVGRLPPDGYAGHAEPGRLEGLRIGVVREYMDKEAFTEEDEETIDLVSAAVTELEVLGATLVDPGSGGALFDQCVRRWSPQLRDRQFTAEYPDRFPFEADGTPYGNHIATLIELAADLDLVAEEIDFRTLGNPPSPGQGRYWLDRYLSERGDANIRSTSDLLEKANFYDDPNFPDHRARHERALAQHEFDMVARMHSRFAVQTMVMACMAQLDLDAVVYPTSNLPPVKLGSPRGPEINGRAGDGVWRFLGGNGFPAITVPVGFTTVVYDRIRVLATPESDLGNEDSETQIVGPVVARLPIGMDIVARPFGEPMILRIAAAYEAATGHREPPADFGPLSGAEAPAP